VIERKLGRTREVTNGRTMGNGMNQIIFNYQDITLIMHQLYDKLKELYVEEEEEVMRNVQAAC
jgi:hypothetical protein